MSGRDHMGAGDQMVFGMGLMTDKMEKFKIIIDGMEICDVVSCLRTWPKYDEFLDIMADECVDEDLVVSLSAMDDMREELAEARVDAGNLEIDVERLHEAICEGRHQDAIDILAEATNSNLRSLSSMKNLFPNRIL